MDACFRCVKLGHYVRECRGKNVRPQGQVVQGGQVAQGAQTQQKGGSSFDKASEARNKKDRNPHLACDKCGKVHLGECLLGQDGCYTCSELGHKRRDCPNVARRGKERARNSLPFKYVLLWLG